MPALAAPPRTLAAAFEAKGTSFFVCMCAVSGPTLVFGVPFLGVASFFGVFEGLGWYGGAFASVCLMQAILSGPTDLELGFRHLQG